MRIGRNLAFHGQPYFNLGERVFGDSSPVWLSLVALAFRVAGRADVRAVVVLACLSLAALGWTFPGKILDGVGLVSPEVLQFHPLRVPEERPGTGVGAVPAAVLACFRPDYLVALNLFTTDYFAKRWVDPGLADYDVVAARPIFDPSLGQVGDGSLWGATAVLVIERRGACRP